MTISACYDWPRISGILPYLTCLLITQDFFRLDSTFAQLYNAAALPASHLFSADSFTIIMSRTFKVTGNHVMYMATVHDLQVHTALCCLLSVKIGRNMTSIFCSGIKLQSLLKLFGTLQVYLVSPIPPINVGKYSFSSNKKGKKVT